jgi:hypothetical protein
MLYYISLFSKIRCSLIYLPTQKSDVIYECSHIGNRMHRDMSWNQLPWEFLPELIKYFADQLLSLSRILLSFFDLIGLFWFNRCFRTFFTKMRRKMNFIRCEQNSGRKSSWLSIYYLSYFIFFPSTHLRAGWRVWAAEASVNVGFGFFQLQYGCHRWGVGWWCIQASHRL